MAGDSNTSASAAGTKETHLGLVVSARVFPIPRWGYRAFACCGAYNYPRVQHVRLQRIAPARFSLGFARWKLAFKR